ncbi:MAG TPA: hypothetical protein VHA53_07065 [Nitrolancea sp.]|jgi:hypothetical protein|nr:hypothetical protein [Nitrolancea sp.]
MATKHEIVEAIQAGIEQVETTFGSLNDQQMASIVFERDGGSTAKEDLSQLAAGEPDYERATTTRSTTRSMSKKALGS